MTLYERLRYRLSVLWAAVKIGPSPSLLKLALTMPRIAGASDDEGKDEGKDEDKVTMTKAEADQLRRKASESDKAARKLEAKVADLEAKIEDADAGSDEVAKLTKQLEREKARADKAEGRVNELEDQIETAERDSTVSRVAKRLGFRDPDMAIRLIEKDDAGSEANAEKALKGLLKTSPYLKEPGKPQREVTGSESEGDDQDKSEGTSEKKPEVTGEARLSSAYAQQSGDNNKE
jgi:septal ring factor EnvC (AmiA/AmiB activator)